ncbi:MAG TPA: DUF4383 domain-containing protein [Acidimicrobiales bacterium]|nr:DUF4383 domain-containing protein [Acidimicrobiales bacterium]
MAADTRRNDYHWVQWLALAVGATYTLVGLVGFAITGFDRFAEHTGDTLVGFEINPLHNIVHLVIGLLGLAMWRRFDTARTYGWMLAVGYGAAFVLGLVIIGDEDKNFLSLNVADQFLHIGSALVGLAMALAKPGQGAGRTSDSPRRTRAAR